MYLNSLLAIGLAVATVGHADPRAGQFEEVGNTIVSAMMMFLGRSSKVYIIDKVEGNSQKINGHPVFASVWDLETRNATAMDVQTNPFCAAGMHLPNGSFAVFGGNNAVGPGGSNNAPGSQLTYDPTYKDYNGTRSIRVVTPCDGDVHADPTCGWYDSPHSGLLLQSGRWYPAAEALGNGSVILIGGFSSGGFLNRNWPNTDPFYSDGKSNPTYEVYPYNGVPERVMQFMGKTSGLNSYALTFLMASGKLFVQANYSTILFDADNNIETDLPDMPGKIARVYPASGANTMLPLTVANNYEQTVLFCGGFFMEDEEWGDFHWPYSNPWERYASNDCQRMTPEPADGSQPAYVQDDDLPQPRSMSQFILLPDGKILLLNGAQNGTAGYGSRTKITPPGQMPFGQSYATDPVLQPLIYDPNAPAGSRWSSEGLSPSKIPRLYHSSALLLPDGSVMVAGSNPNADWNLTAIYPTTYKAEYFYPPYFNATSRPVPSGIPSTLSYGGDPFNITLPASSYAGSSNDVADGTVVWLSRPGWTTHAMNMGQRMLQLNNTYTVASDGNITLHVAQPPPNANLFQPGPAYVWVTVNGVPSNGTFVTVGNGQLGTQPTAPPGALPASVRVNSAQGTLGGAGPSGSGSHMNSGAVATSSMSRAAVSVGCFVAAVAAVFGAA